MNDQNNQPSHGHERTMLETTDALEALGVFRGWKNFLFFVILIALLVIQGSFWIAHLSRAENGDGNLVLLSQSAQADVAEDFPAVLVQQEDEEIDQAAERAVTDDPNESEPAVEPEEPREPAEPVESEDEAFLGLTFENLGFIVNLSNFVLVIAAVLYCLTLLFGLKVSLVAGLGGVSFISRGFYLSLVMTVLILPWQQLFAPVVTGMIFMPEALIEAAQFTHENALATGMFYLRYTGYWFVVLFLLFMSQARNSNWVKATLHRIEVV